MNAQFQFHPAQQADPLTVSRTQALPPESWSRDQVREGNLASALPIALLIFAAILGIWFLNSFLRICNPNEILILSGRKHRTKSGEEVGYRVIFGGRVIVIPILETVKRMDLTTMPVPVEVRNAYSKGGTPLDIQAIANVKI
jgi:flotillin